MRRALLVSLGLLVGGAAAAAPVVADAIRASKFYKVDVRQKQVTATADYIQPALRLDLATAATDQPQYWPNEKVYLKVIALSRGGQTLTGTWQKRDAASSKLEVKLNADGVAVVELMDGGQRRLELGEYRVDLASVDKRSSLSTTFTVVDGALGAVSFAHEWRRVTTIAELEKAAGAWFLGNAGGAGARWGNGLSFKNELRAANHRYSGHARINSRCMLPGCNGTFAGRTLEAEIKDGHVAGTLDVGGHSGPFQIEVVTDQGSLRHQFEGSSHVEREMLVVAGNVGYAHRVGLAPYEGTKQIPGRQLYVESKPAAGGPYELSSIVADRGAAQLTIKKAVKRPQVTVWRPRPDGTYAAHAQPQQAELAAGARLGLPVAAPYSLVTIGGFVDGKFQEGWALVFTPSQLKVVVEAGESGAPGRPATISVAVQGGGRVSGVLEVYDNRVASKSAASGLGSALGDSVRATSRAVARWRDNTGIVDEEVAARPRERDRKRAAGDAALGGLGTIGRGGGGGAGSGYGRGAAGISLAAPTPMKMVARRPSGGGGGGSGAGPDEDEAPKEIIREGEKKVVYCGLVQTDAEGRARVAVTLPPQTGRVVARFVAVKGLDHAEGQTQLDVKLGAYADARLPKVIVPGAELSLQVDVTNTLKEPVTLLVRGTGIAQELRKSIAPGVAREEVRLMAKESGLITVQLADGSGKVLDRRELPLTLLEDQQVTYSRLELGGTEITVGADEEVVVYDGAGALLKGVVMNMVTTTESWFGHAEALAARVAVRAVLLAAIDRGLLEGEGLTEQLRSGLAADARALDEKFCDAQGLCRPYPGLPPSALWSGWVSRNLHAALRALRGDRTQDARVAEARALAQRLVGRIDGALQRQGLSLEAQAGTNAAGDAVIPIEVDGKVVYRALTDDAVSRWAVDKLLPQLDWDARDGELAFARAYDKLRFLKAFERTGALQYLTDIASALYQKGERARFAQLYRQITRGMILTQEPGLLQGPALLGGVYSTPMAMVRFLELQLLLAARPARGGALLVGRPLAFGARAQGGGKLTFPEGAIARIDRKQRLRWDESQNLAWAEARVSAKEGKVGQELGLEITLAADLDPAEHYAIVAVPSTVAVKQTEDILSDYKGQLIYGQQATGGTRTQLVTVPFRGSRSMRLVLEGAYPGHAVGKVLVRHIEQGARYSVRAIGEITVR